MQDTIKYLETLFNGVDSKGAIYGTIARNILRKSEYNALDLDDIFATLNK